MMAKSQRTARGSKASGYDAPAASKDKDKEAADLAARWIDEIDNSKELFKPWWEKCEKIVKRYKDERAESDTKTNKGARKYNVLWSVTQTMQPLVYNRAPQPYISRRNNDRDPVGRDASMILQRAIAYTLEGDELHDALVDAREDYLLTSRGVPWMKYTPYLKLRDSELKTYIGEDEDLPDDVPEDTEVKSDKKGRYYNKKFEDKVFEEVDSEHVLYSDFLHSPAAKWSHVTWVARRVPMTRKALVERFGDVGKKVPLTIGCKRGTKDNDNDDAKGRSSKGEVWEIWDKCSKTVIWVCPGVPEHVLDKKDDPLELMNFFPCPRPAYSTKTNDTLVPTPDFVLWQGVANELDDITLRIKLLTEAVRVVGVYDKTAGDHLKKLFSQTAENEMVPVDSWGMFAEKGGIKGAIEFMPVEQIMVVLDKLYMARERLLKELYEITGVSDIVRGASDPRETAKAQQIKGNFANKRLSEKQNTFARMARESIEIIAQIICAHYSDDMIRQISSAEQIMVDPNTNQWAPQRFAAALALLRNAPMRRFRVKIDEKNLASADETEEREGRTQFVQGMSQFLQAALPMAKELPGTVPMLKELLLFAVRGFPMARSTEASIEAALDSLTAASVPPEAQESTGPAPKSPEEIAIEKEKNDIDRQRLGIEHKRLLLDEWNAKKNHEYRMAALQQKETNAQRDNEVKTAKTLIDAKTKVAQVDEQRAARQDERELNVVSMEQEAATRSNDSALEVQRFNRDTEVSDRDAAFREKEAARQAKIAAFSSKVAA
jgi:hypothetical protein